VTGPPAAFKCGLFFNQPFLEDTDMAIYKHKGESIDYTPTGAVTAGDVVVQGLILGVACNDIAANELGSLTIEGVFRFTTSATFDVGDMAFYASGTDTITATDTDVYAGRVVLQPSATEVDVKINFLTEALGS